MFYHAKYEKKKLVKVIKESKFKIWFEHDSKRYCYDKQKFFVDFVKEEA